MLLIFIEYFDAVVRSICVLDEVILQIFSGIDVADVASLPAVLPMPNLLAKCRLVLIG